MKNKVMWVVIGWVLVAGIVWTVSAYSTNIWSPIQFVKQLFVTPNGEIDQSKATIKINGVNGRIDAKSMYVNWQEVVTKWNAWMFKKNGTNAYYNNWNVWIWTTDPQAKLDVNGNMNISIDKKLNWDSRNWYGYYDYTQIASFSNKSAPLGNWDTRVLSIAQGKNWSAVIRWVWRNIRLQAQGWTLSVDWNVWIWTTDPQAKLDVNGDIAINGLKTIQMKTQTIRLKWDIKHYYPVIIHFDWANFYNKITITAKPRWQLTNTPNAFWNKCNHWNCYDYSHQTNVFINYEGLTNSRWTESHFLKKDWFDDAHDVKNCILTIAWTALMCYMAWNRHYSFHWTFSSIDVYYTPGDHRLSCHYGRWSCWDYDNKWNGKWPKYQWLDYHTVYSR